MKQLYLFEYLNENEFKKLERSVKKYNMLAYKKLVFEFYPKMKEGNFLGKLVDFDDEKNTKKFSTRDHISPPLLSEYTKQFQCFTIDYNRRLLQFFNNCKESFFLSAIKIQLQLTSIGG